MEDTFEENFTNSTDEYEIFEINSTDTFDLYDLLHAIDLSGQLFQDYFWIASCFSNLFHLFILLHKELRSSGSYTIMIGICIADLTIAIISLENFAVKLSLLPETYPIPPQCLRSDYKSFIPLLRLRQQVDTLGRRLSVWLAILLVFIRAVSVKFHMKRWVEKINKPRVAIYMMTGVATFWLFFDSWQFLFTTVFWLPDNVDDICKVLPEKYIKQIHVYAIPTNFQRIVSYIFELSSQLKIMAAICHLSLTVYLSIQLRTILRRRRRLSGTNNVEAAVNTKLILFISIAFSITQCVGALTVIDYSGDAISIKIITTALTISNNLRTLNSISNVFVCYFMSVQYKNAVKSLAFWRRREVYVVEDISLQTIYQARDN
ncbi:G_PROTEIN_RECEP_F1_2 domain-containing protein [Caenorhabditis elegans]|uniref:G_PROTEIN_RECEP_F1_2 domain-containing protein n=1 Tax=Caenorhabditis elegans TaxID=6239 RepID=Q86D05_CAEEL|nr:G_PROTEIN_RECEP_F1_2 domain-containing protein [Caenorhabditis elegans]CAD89748.1 G_PROTEIN_RECEP_F1_2 domain-containing protein [Caenorhabditis elegans]|eukprot:NP_001024058.1 Serpentine Receptor, class W [Caenorhabditis elegans]